MGILVLLLCYIVLVLKFCFVFFILLYRSVVFARDCPYDPVQCTLIKIERESKLDLV
jgi:hypothetical protein